MNYQTVSMFNKRNVDYGRINDADLEDIRQTANACITENARLHNDAIRLHAEMLKSAEIIYGTGAELRYIREHKVPPPPDLHRAYKLFVDKANERGASSPSKRSGNKLKPKPDTAGV